MRVVLLGAAVLLLSACSVGRMCPMYRVADGGGVTVDASAYVTAHPSVAKLCLPAGLCRPIERFTIPGGGLDPHHIDLTVTTATGTVLLHATAIVRMHHVDPDPGCGNDFDAGSITIAADGSVATS
ncbi:hypothetical protein [Actinoplanes subtropicus]|uniref:hypothetical protein n=1 Tax=Actinoplanes subtropicus TaxID=543632 RepID=UPI0012FB0C6E|nr:hypothetical protein [Actinoplanes subtropicus]